MTRCACLLGFVLLAVTLGCGGAAPTPTATPTSTPTPTVPTLSLAPAPGGLARLQLPVSPDGVAALLSQLPAEIAGKRRNTSAEHPSPDRYTAEYGEARGGLGPPLRLMVINVATGDFFPKDWTGTQVVAVMAKGGDWQVTGSGKDGSVAWVRLVTKVSAGGPSLDEYAIQWAQGESPWTFGIVADSPQNADAFLVAFVAAVRKAAP